MRGVAIVATLMAVLPAGCRTVAERYSPEGGESGVELPGRYLRDGGGGAAMPDGGKWWEVFGDAELERLVERCGRANWEIGVALARVRASHAALGVTRSAAYPSLVADGSAGLRRDSEKNLLFPLDEPEYERYRLGATASWEVDLWGRVGAMSERDRLRAEAEDARFVSLGLPTACVNASTVHP